MYYSLLCVYVWGIVEVLGCDAHVEKLVMYFRFAIDIKYTELQLYDFVCAFQSKLNSL